jgi:hypothetical protein
MDNITKILLGVVTVAVVATVLVNGSQAANVIKAGGSAFSGSLTAAEKG